MNNLPPCPRCRTAKCVRVKEDKLFICDNCHGLFDGIDDGDIGYGRQDRYAERKEGYENRQRQRQREIERRRGYR